MAIFSAIAAGITWAFNAVFANALVASFGFYGAAAIGMAVGQIGAAAIAIGISRALQPKINIPVSEIQAVLNQTEAARRIYVGKNLTGGIRAFFHTKSGMLYQLVVIGHGRINSFAEFWVDGEPVTVSSGAVTSTDKAGFMWVATRDGSGQGGNYPALSDAFPATWGANRRLQSQATFLVRMKAPAPEDFAKIFPKSYNTAVQWVIEGQAIHDPRSNTSAYGDNAALVIAHYLTHADGYRLASGEVDWLSVEAMADVADLPIPQKAGGTAPNLRLWGYWTLDEGPVDVLDRMHASSGIRAYETQDGKIGLIGGGFGTPATTLTAKDISSIVTKEAINERDGYNVLVPFFLSEDQKFTVTELEPWRDEDRLAEEGEVSAEYRMEMCPNQSQARRLAKKQIHDDNRAKVEVVTNLAGLKARYPRFAGQRHTILLDYRPEDGSGRQIVGEYEVLNHQFDPINLECRIELAKVDRASEAWDPEEEGELIVAPPTPELDAPPELDAVVTQRIINTTGTTAQAVIEVAAVPIPDRDDLVVQAEYSMVSPEAGYWQRMVSSGMIATSPAISDRAIYAVRARWTGLFEGVDDWENLGSITIQVDATPPGQPSELIPSNGSGYVHLSWRNPTGAFASIRVYRNGTNDFGTATMIGSTGGASGQISEYQDDAISAATTYYYWVVAANVSSVEGTPAGPASITTP
ncbi:hypothetical protein [Paracoccus versutus]|uniref:Fibronectin type-III domain-containing protein n=1 Tax=Paracoccus versutus TaxID=34007 RepID=A0A3D9XLK5_PARVE|nr:hypothetical protein [Paracoccus versutus]REF69963.1 hypothetical protein BDD41_2682 [Paracoccus versutus]WGR57694.1 hypothetical protein E3U25_17165 [Paracoccus versutus]